MLGGFTQGIDLWSELVPVKGAEIACAPEFSSYAVTACKDNLIICSI